MEYQEKVVWETFDYVNLKYKRDNHSGYKQLPIISKLVEAKYLRIE